jgi:uncharacterized protein DUF5681
MSARGRPKPASTRKNAEVGYRKPPKGTRFKPGQSGNPKGRPKGVPNFETDLEATLRAPVKNANGSGTMSVQRAVLQAIADKGVDGDPRATQQLINLIHRYLKGNKSEGPAILLDEDDRAILDEYYYDRQAREAEQVASGSLPTEGAMSNPLTTDKRTLQ